MPEGGQSSPTSVSPAFRWLRFGAGGGSGRSRQSDKPDPAAIARVAREARRELLDEIAEFLLANDLAINPANLAIAWNAFSGSSPNLRRRLDERVRAGQPVSQPWLDEVSAHADAERERDALRQAMDELSESVTRFTHTTKAAHSATTAYNSALGRHVVELGELGEGAEEGEVVQRLASLAEEMVERTRVAEAELKSSEQEAKALRRRLDKARRDAERDHLTGLPNRRAFEAELERQYAEASTSRETLCVAFCDIDHFKRINDRHGHDAGDRVLKVIAQTLARSCDDNCHVSRHGGEEFVLLFRGKTPSEAKARLDEAREDLASRRLLNRETDEPFGQITFSAGVADVFAHGDPRDALKAADGALYRAKETGRNRVEMA